MLQSKKTKIEQKQKGMFGFFAGNTANPNN